MSLTVTELPTTISVGATGVHRNPYHIEIHQRLGGAGLYSPPPPLGGGSDDKARLDTWLASTPANSTLEFKEGYLVSAPLAYLTGRRYRGRGIAEFSGGGVKLRNGANPTDATTAVMVPKEWNDNNTAGGNPTIFENFFIDGNAANNTGTYGCLLLSGFWSRVKECWFANPRLDNVRLTRLMKNGSAASIDMADNWIYNNRFSHGLAGTDGAGVRHISTGGNNNADMRCVSNHFENMQNGILVDDALGWTILDNHIWGRRNGINLTGGWFATRVIGNYIDGFGQEATAGTFYFGIRAKGFASRGCIISANEVNTSDPAGTATFYCYAIEGGDAAMVSVGPNNAYGANTARGHAYNFNGSGAGPMVLAEALNNHTNFVAGQGREYQGLISYSYPRIETGTASWTPGTVGANSTVTQVITVPGAALGDPVAVGYNQTLDNALVLGGYVSAANTVTAKIRNNTGAGIAVTAGTVRATVWKH
jgi:hypothetical protein